MNGLDLFSGIGGLTKALEGYVRPVAYCENDRYAQSILLSRMWNGDIPKAPIWDDVRTLRKQELEQLPEIIYGGFPCQDISVAGRGAGLAGERSGLFFEIVRLIGDLQPRFVFLENVAAITVRGAERVVGELCRLGYDCRWGILSAADVGANHRRERWWLLAHAMSSGEWRYPRESEIGKNALAHTPRIGCGENGPREFNTSSQNVADTHGAGFEKRRRPEQPKTQQHTTKCACENVADAESAGQLRTEQLEDNNGCKRRRKVADDFDAEDQVSEQGWWSVEPSLGRVAHGVPQRVDRLRGLGNAVVPAQAREAFERLMGLK